MQEDESEVIDLVSDSDDDVQGEKKALKTFLNGTYLLCYDL